MKWQPKIKFELVYGENNRKVFEKKCLIEYGEVVMVDHGEYLKEAFLSFLDPTGSLIINNVTVYSKEAIFRYKTEREAREHGYVSYGYPRVIEIPERVEMLGDSVPY